MPIYSYGGIVYLGHRIYMPLWRKIWCTTKFVILAAVHMHTLY